MTKLGIQDRIELVMVDYRNIPQSKKFDKISSIEMIEHVGYEHYPIYFGKISSLLKVGGRAAI